MNENWDGDLPKIKVEQEEIKLEDLQRDEFIGTIYNEESLESYDKNDNLQNKKIKVDLEKPDDKVIQKIVLFFAFLFFLVALPLTYHGLKDYFFVSDNDSESRNLIVTVKKYSPVDIYTKSESTGEILPESSVDVVARVEGYLQKTFIKEGQSVNKGQLLFQIEPEEYAIAVRASEASVAQAQAFYKNALQELDRGKELVKENFISRSDFDQMVAQAASSKASLDEVQQSLARARLNLSYTNIYSPLSGKAGAISLSDGNFVTLSSGPLVNIAKTTPILVSFSMKSSDVIRMKHDNNGKLDISNAKVELILSDDSKYKRVGKIIFSNNYVSSEAASLALKAKFDNPENLLIPGDFVKVIVTSATPVKRILVPQSVVRGDALNGYYVWTAVNGKTAKKNLEVAGSMDNQWIVESGLTENDAVIIKSNTYIETENRVINETKTDIN